MSKQGMAGLLLLAAMSAPSSAELLLFYDFNDASDANVVVDRSGKGNNGEVIDAEYTADGGGRTGLEGDRAMNLGDFNDDAYVDIVTAEEGAFSSLIETDMVTLSMWV